MSEQNNKGNNVGTNNSVNKNDEVKRTNKRVAGFYFANEAEAKQAAKEAEGVKYIKEKTDMDKPEMVLNIYRKMVQQNLFETAVGFAYLKELQEYLQSVPLVRNEDILPIPVKHTTLEASFKARNKRTESAPTEKKVPQVVNINYKTKFRVARTLSIVLAICVVAMFAITATTNNTTILNYEQEIIDRYEAWESELSEREAAIKEREAELDIVAE